MITIRVPGLTRSSIEANFYISLHPCPACGSRDATSIDFGNYGSANWSETGPIEFKTARCDRCGEQRRFLFASTSGDIAAWEPIGNGHIAGSMPSGIISPAAFLTEIDRVAPDLVRDPHCLLYEAYARSWNALKRSRTCWVELAKFLPEGADAIPPSHLWTDADRSIQVTTPHRLTRGYIEAGLADIQATLDVYLADRERYWALRDAAKAAAPPPPAPPAFTKQSLDEHRAFVRRKDGQPPAGRRLEATDVAQPGIKLSTQELSGSILTRVNLRGADLSFVTAHHLRWTEVDLSGANVSNAELYNSMLTKVDFSRANLVLSNLGDGRHDDCVFAGASLDRSTWYRSDLARCDFRGAVFGQAAFRGVVFADGDFRGASFAADPRGVLGDLWRTWFYRCDLRDVDWSGRVLEENTYVDCTFGPGPGPRKLGNLCLLRCTIVTPTQTITDCTLADLVRLWAIPPEAVIGNDTRPRIDDRRVTRKEIRDGHEVRVTGDEWPALVLEEYHRDPTRNPLPTPWDSRAEPSTVVR
ncbi:MAG: pentapeptide repeat-containing protein [Kofleriaceae bacterium]